MKPIGISTPRWHEVIQELKGEKRKPRVYDTEIYKVLGSVAGQRWLDYGAGPAVMAEHGKKAGADMYAWDIDPRMREECAHVLGNRKVFNSVQEMRREVFDIITCNLVLCIVSEREVNRIASRVRKMLQKDGIALFGFCNPQIFDVPETQFDVRNPTGNTYWDHHRINKLKKEAKKPYPIFDLVRSLDWYHGVMYNAGLEQTGMLTTAPYKLKGNNRTIRDFVILQHTVV